jgi:hypothetical protein
VRRWYRAGAEGAALLVGAGLGIMGAACSSESDKAPGVLMLALSTDMEVPKDFDQVLVKVDSQSKLFAFGTSAKGGDCGTSADDAKELRLPLTLGLESRKTGTTKVTVKACRKGKEVLTRMVTVAELPSAGDKRVPLLRIPIDSQCTDEAGKNHSGCTSSVKASELPAYSAENVFGGAGGPGSDGQCFDTLQAFQGAPALEVGESGCMLPSVPQGGSLGLVKPPGTKGICGRAACYVPIDAQIVDEWRNPLNPQEVALPDPFCTQLSKGNIRAVVMPTVYPVQTESLPTCGAWSSVTSRSGWVEDPLPAGDALVAYWNMNGGAISEKWVDATYQGHDVALSHVESSSTRIGGRGYAARFDGNAYAMLSETGSLFEGAFTLAAWVSFFPGDGAPCMEATADWPVLSTRSSDDPCVGYELAIRCTAQNEPSVVFGYGCEQGELGEIVAPLPKNSGTWTAGDWYHVAVTYDKAATPHAVLFLDGQKVTPEDKDDVGSPSSAPLTFYVGTDAARAKSALGVFQGYLDDILVFGRALDTPEVAEIYSDSATVGGPGGFRWGTWDTSGSVATLSDESTREDLRVHIEDGSCSSGGAVAHVGDDVLFDADKATLTANIPKGVWFEFGLSGPHALPQCTWYGEGQGEENQTYEFDLKQPGWCTYSECSIPRGSMQTVTVSTHWKDSGSRDFSITGLAFSGDDPEWSWEGVADSSLEDENGQPILLCWKPVTYEPAPYATALWSNKNCVPGSGWNDPEWPVCLSGTPKPVEVGTAGSTAEVSAFIIGGTLDLGGCTEIKIDADRSEKLEITLEAADGTSCQYDSLLGSGPIPLGDDNKNHWTCFGCEGGGSEFSSVRGAVTRIAVRKPWTATFEDPVSLTIHGVRFGGNGCARLAQ